MYFPLQVVLISCVLLLAQAQLNCPSLPSRPTPTNVNDLHPNDIKVVMALGDSITAGFGLMGRKGLVEEYRGQSWSIGGDPNATTMFNFMKYYTPTVVGGSLGHHVVEICIDPDCPAFQYQPTLDVFNAAQSGAEIADLTPHELDYLIAQLQANPNVDMANDWKVLTLLIGANDLCGVCDSAQPWLEPDVFEVGVTNALERVRTTVPRVFVNLVQMFNLSGVYSLSLQSDYCVDVHKDLSGECGCIFASNGNVTRPMVDAVTQLINARMVQIAQDYQAKNYTDFTVVVQPFGSETVIDSLPFDFISTLDCFHPSLFAHQSMAIALWNNMITPAANKKTVIDVNDTPLCPTADTLLYTY